MVLWAGASTLRFRIRFCLAPTSSSPSISRTGPVAFIDEPELGDASLLRDLGDAGAASLQGLVEQQVVGLGDAVGKQREETEVSVVLGLTQLGFGQTLGNSGHGDLPESDALGREHSPPAGDSIREPVASTGVTGRKHQL